MKLYQISIVSIILFISSFCSAHKTIINIKAHNAITALCLDWLARHKKIDLKFSIDTTTPIKTVVNQIQQNISKNLNIQVHVKLLGSYYLMQNYRGHINLVDSAYASETLYNQQALLEPQNKDDKYHYIWALVG